MLLDKHQREILVHSITRCCNTKEDYMITSIQHIHTHLYNHNEFTMAYIQAYTMKKDTHYVLLFYVRNSDRFVLIDGQGREWEVL